MTKLADLRKSYMKGSLSEEDVQANPVDQFKIWFDQAQQAELPEPNAMTVASVDENGKPSARIVLIKEVTQEGFVFFTNYDSQRPSFIGQSSLSPFILLARTRKTDSN